MPSQNFTRKDIGLRVRMTLLMLVAVVPFIVILIAGRVHQYREKTDKIYDEAVLLALQIAAYPQLVIPDPYAYLSNFSYLPEMQQPENCKALKKLTQSVLRTNPYFTTLAVFLPNGDLICPEPNPVEPQNVKDREYFRRILREQKYTISNLVIGKLSGKRSIIFSHPIADERSELKYVLTLGLDAEWLTKFLNDATPKAQLSRQVVVMAVDDAGTVIAATPGSSVQAAAKIPAWSALAPRLRESKTFVQDEIWADGVHRATAYVPLFGAPSGIVRIRVGVPIEPALAVVHHDNLEQLSAGVLVVFAILSIAWLGSEQLIVRPINRLRSVATALTEGDFAARVPGAHQKGELGELARAFNSMAEQIQGDREDLSVLATRDPLTGLPNRTSIRSELEQSIRAAEQSQRSVAVILLDLNGFKEINDSLGHPVGDKVLVQITNALHEATAGHGKVGRLGGDEFVAWLENVVDEGSAGSVAHRIIDGIKKPITVEGQQFFLSGSVGIALFPAHGGDVDTLLQNADIAMYKAKAENLQAPVFYSREMNERFADRLRMQNLLSQALARRELELHYQPKIAALTGEISGAEALVRWRHPELGLVSPAEFIPLAEKTGLIVEIGEWVLLEACRQLKSWQSSLPGDFSIAVNVSPRQFSDPDMLGKFRHILTQTGINPAQVELEITEGALMHNPAHAIEALEALRAFGTKVSIDDFGTGYSSLSYLKHLPVDALKIDRSFVSGLPENKSDHTLVSAVVAIATDLGLRVTAEGVETEAQYHTLQSIGCGEMQGYYFSRPVPADTFLATTGKISRT